MTHLYPVVYLDAIHFTFRHAGRYETRAFYTAYSIDWAGQRDLLGLSMQSSESATRWRLVLEDFRGRGVEDVLVVCTDNLQGFSEAISDVFPASVCQKCVVHQVRNSWQYVDEKDRKAVASDLRKVYSAASREQAQVALDGFGVKWGGK